MPYFISFLFPDGLQASAVCEFWKGNFDVLRFFDAMLHCLLDLNAFDVVVCIQIMTRAVGLLGGCRGMEGLWAGGYEGIIGSMSICDYPVSIQKKKCFINEENSVAAARSSKQNSLLLSWFLGEIGGPEYRRKI